MGTIQLPHIQSNQTECEQGQGFCLSIVLLYTAVLKKKFQFLIYRSHLNTAKSSIEQPYVWNVHTEITQGMVYLYLPHLFWTLFFWVVPG